MPLASAGCLPYALPLPLRKPEPTLRSATVAALAPLSYLGTSLFAIPVNSVECHGNPRGTPGIGGRGEGDGAVADSYRLAWPGLASPPLFCRGAVCEPGANGLGAGCVVHACMPIVCRPFPPIEWHLQIATSCLNQLIPVLISRTEQKVWGRSGLSMGPGRP